LELPDQGRHIAKDALAERRPSCQENADLRALAFEVLPRLD
jgi:hypothetical protein